MFSWLYLCMPLYVHNLMHVYMCMCNCVVSAPVFFSRKGPISGCLWGDLAESVCRMWNEVQERRARGEVAACIVELDQVRIQGVSKNSWNGESLTRIRTLSSVGAVGKDLGTTIARVPQATTDNLRSMTYAVPPAECCVSIFRSLRNKLSPPFRVTLRGVVVDAQPMDTSQGGNPKRVFDLVDKYGTYVSCCAMKHNAESAALQNLQEVVLYYGTGRGPIGNARGMVYLLKDAMIIPVGQSSLLSTGKTTFDDCVSCGAAFFAVPQRFPVLGALRRLARPPWRECLLEVFSRELRPAQAAS